ncbi:MAG TPA: hypothetical protein DD412_00070 [Holosporales bacterium]|nr:hypothetical protein [Holosporales bacterium]
MILSTKKLIQGALLSLGLMIMTAPMAHGSTGGVLPDIEEMPLGLKEAVRPESAKESVEDFVTWSRSIRVNVVDRHKDDDPTEERKRHVDFLATHTSAPWYVISFRQSFIPEDDGEYTYVQAMNVLLEAKQLGGAFSQFTTNLFKLFEDEAIDSWDTSFIEQKEEATSEEKKATVRHMMLLLENMTMQAYATFAELGVNKRPVDVEEGSKADRDYQKALLEAHEAFADDCHFNPLLLAAQTTFPEASHAYELFMSPLLDTCARQSLAFTGHPLHSTAVELDLSCEEYLFRLALKADILEKKTLPYLDFAKGWFAALAPVYLQKADAAVDGKEALQEKATDYAGRAELFGQYHTVLTNRLKAIKVEREELAAGLEVVEDPTS